MLAPDLSKKTLITLNGNEVFKSDTTNRFSIDSDEYTDNGVYTCKVTFGTDSIDTKTLNQYVRYIANTGTAFGIEDNTNPKNAILSCVFYGDDLDVTNNPVSWIKSGTTITTGGDYALSDGSYDSATLTRTATLTISNYETNKNGEYVCTGSYTAPSATLTSTVTISGVGKLLSSITFLNSYPFMKKLLRKIKSRSVISECAAIFSGSCFFDNYIIFYNIIY